MELATELSAAAPEVLARAAAALDRAGLAHYVRDTAVSHERLADLYAVLVDCSREHTLVPAARSMETIARQRFGQGFDICEVQTAVNALEEAVWSYLVAHRSAEEVAEALAFVSAALGAAKDTLGRVYVELASQHRRRAVDAEALLTGGAAG